jgi:hypothetical protein
VNRPRAEQVRDELERIEEMCPDCAGMVEVTPSSAIVCREYGSSHYRWEPQR